MKQRATNGYGMNVDELSENTTLLAGDPLPEAMWIWLDAIRNVEGMDSMDGMTFRGIRNTLSGSASSSSVSSGKSSKSEQASLTWDGAPSSKQGIAVYTSNDRYDILLAGGRAQFLVNFIHKIDWTK